MDDCVPRVHCAARTHGECVPPLASFSSVAGDKEYKAVVIADFGAGQGETKKMRYKFCVEIVMITRNCFHEYIFIFERKGRSNPSRDVSKDEHRRR